MKKISLLSILILIIVFTFSYCNRKANASNGNSGTERTAQLVTLSKNGITLTELYSPETFTDATLLQSTNAGATELDSNQFTLNYTATNYEFGKQTTMNAIKTCANSAQGQHVHAIVDNGPYTAVYKNNVQLKAKNDGQHIVLSFLSRSYHESIKNKNAYALTSVITGMSRYTARYAAPELDKPMLFYSRPKGEYTGIETDAVLLDFYLVNCDLSKKGYKVKAEINGTTFMLDKWCGYFMEGLPMGENTVKLTLLDSKGNTVESPYSVSERKFILKK
ncbi:MAG TPA: hypothetical protein PKK18_11155 [Chitinophagales bacterium]|nr:hypothetical protein [Chitinophagales bacterium]HMW13869.1 hypothetical protein [Chitinophagales bacterium]HMX61075.1 hypothetical protein [Chitinophagales bacterium]HMZ34627.1 hypothetical protein [Chitinophagales bacterium]HNC72620.1 hypothetical protein [Chitinophagales bacterium]